MAAQREIPFLDGERAFQQPDLKTIFIPPPYGGEKSLLGDSLGDASCLPTCLLFAKINYRFLVLGTHPFF